MAKKAESSKALDKKVLAKLAGLGVTKVTTEDEARKKLIKLLADNSVDNVDSESLDELIELYGAFAGADDGAATSEEEVYNEAADEDDEDEGDDDEDSDDDDEDEEDDEEEPVKKAPAKKAAVPSKRAPAVPTKKAPEKKAPTRSRMQGEYFMPKTNEKHAAMLNEPFVENDMYDGVIDDFKLLKLGFTAYKDGAAAKRAVFSYDRMKLIDGKLVGDLFFNALKGLEEVTDAVDLDCINRDASEFKPFNLTLIFIPRVTPDEVNEILSTNGLLDKMCERIAQADKKAVKARKKMEEKMEQPAKKTAPKAPPAATPAKGAKKPVPAPVEEEDDEEEETPAPAKGKKVGKK